MSDWKQEMTFSEFIEKLRRGEIPGRKMGEQPPWMEPTPSIIRAKPDSPIAVPLETVRKAFVDDRPTVLAIHKPELSMHDITTPINKPGTAISTHESVQIIGGLHDYATCVPKPKWIEPAHYMSFELERMKKKMSNIPKIPFTYTTVNGGTPTFAATFKLEDLYTSMQYVKDTWPDAEMRLFGIPFVTVPAIDDVIFNGPATIVMWADGDKTVVKQQSADVYSEETGLAMCIAKKALGNKGRFNEVFKKWIPGYGNEWSNPETEVYRKKFKDLLRAYNYCKDNGGSDIWTNELLDSCKAACFYAPNGAELYLKLDSAMISHQEVMGIAETVLRHKGMLPNEEKKKEELTPDGTNSV